MAKVMLIDGNSLTYRAFFALPTDMATASGQVTNAVFGFTSMLINLLRDHEPDRVVVAFDRPEPTFRHEMVDSYKDGREKAPDILRQQMGLVREVIEAIGIPSLDKVGVEADDIIATLATQARDAGDDAIVVTGDRDVYQLVEDPHIKVLYNKRGVSDYALYDEAGIFERTGVKPTDYVTYAALRGDKSDNLPGVPGVGEKTAAKLVNTYSDLDGIFGAAEDQTPKLKANLLEHEKQARSNLEMMVLVRDVELEVNPDELVLGELDVEEVDRLFDFLEFRSLRERLDEALGGALGGGGASSREVLEPELTRPSAAEAAKAVLALAKDRSKAKAQPVAIAPGWAPGSGPADHVGHSELDLVGLAVTTDGEAAEVLWLDRTALADDAVGEALVTLLGQAATEKKAPRVALHDAKPLARVLATDFGIELRRLGVDTALAAYLLDPAESAYELGPLLERYTDWQLSDEEAAPEGQLDLGGDDTTDSAVVAARAALATDRIVEPIVASLDAQGLLALHDDVEVPLVGVLARMEVLGVGVDQEELQRLNDHLTSECDRLRSLLHEDAGREFNTNSTKQLREILYEDLGLTPGKKTKTGYSTDAATLEKLRGQHPIIEHLLDYREVEKLRGTYGEGLLASVAPDGRIHATFNQTVARTGRLSSDAPNLHNIPVRSEMGRAFRKAFVPGANRRLLIADYNQIELRCIAHLSEDPGLVGAFEAGDDIHTATASRIFGVEPGDVDVAQRSKSKMVSYGLAYGMEAYGLGQRLGIPVGEAKEILDAYFDAFPKVKGYMDDAVAEARERGYTETLFGRRRRIPELSSGNRQVRMAGERQAMNAGIQGLAADIFKVALVNLDAALSEADLDSDLILQVHDEVILEVPKKEEEMAEELTRRVMAEAFDLAVPLEVHLTFADSWAEAK
jgi:DNA polymerase-1